MKHETVETGEFAGWKIWPDDPFEIETVGPFYSGEDDQGLVTAFRAERRHLNAGGIVHGGCLMSFADFSLFIFAMEHLDGDATTVTFSSEFLAGAREGQLVQGRGEVLRAGRAMIFVRGVISAADRPCLNFSGSIMKLPKAP